MASASDIPNGLDGGGQSGPDVSREDILKQIFGDIGKLVEDFTCAVESTVLLHGRMYITSKFICFYSNLFGLEKKIRIPYSHIKNITKENTAMVIPNAIAISTDKKDYIFRSFWDREECFKLLTSYLERYRGGLSMDFRRMSSPPAMTNAANPALPPIEPIPEGTTLLATSISLSPAPAASTATSPAAPAATAAAEETGPAAPPLDRRSSRKMSTTGFGEDGFVDTENGFRSDNRPASVNLTGDAMITYQQELAKAKLKIQVITETLDISLKDFEALFLGDNSPYNFKRYHESVKDTNLVMTQWGEPAPGLGVGREIKFFKPVNLPGLASTRGVKVQRLRKFGQHGLILYSVTRLEDVPAADAFSVDDVIAASVVSEGKISVDISFQVTFLKGTMMKYIIERSTNAEMSKWLEVFFQHLKKTCELFKDGKVNMTAPVEPDPAPAPVASPTISTEPTAVEPTVVKSTSLASQALDLVLEFNNATLGDRLKTVLAILLIAFLVSNAMSWRSTHMKIGRLEQSIQELEKAIRSLQGL